jgi:hypothetical protein
VRIIKKYSDILIISQVAMYLSFRRCQGKKIDMILHTHRIVSQRAG